MSFRFKGHPGTSALVGVVFLGLYASGWKWYGAAIMLGIFGPVYLMGAWERGR